MSRPKSDNVWDLDRPKAVSQVDFSQVLLYLDFTNDSVKTRDAERILV